jgi:hypothetical protein
VSRKQVFRTWDVEQGDLLPAAAKDLVPASHLVHLLRRIVREELDLSGLYARGGSRASSPCSARSGRPGASGRSCDAA